MRWLADPDSLTDSLLRLSGNRLTVELLDEAWVTVVDRALRARLGNADSGRPFWSRKVLLRGCGQPWVMAHTLVPEVAIRGVLRDILSLGNRPLGAYLFSQPGLRREGVECAPWLPGGSECGSLADVRESYPQDSGKTAPRAATAAVPRPLQAGGWGGTPSDSGEGDSGEGGSGEDGRVHSERGEGVRDGSGRAVAWGRRSTFALRGQRLMVAEFFRPELIELAGN